MADVPDEKQATKKKRAKLLFDVVVERPVQCQYNPHIHMSNMDNMLFLHVKTVASDAFDKHANTFE